MQNRNDSKRRTIMNTRKLATITFAAVALTLMTAALLSAAPLEPGKELRQRAYNAPIAPHAFLKAHSEAWNDAYFDKNTRTQPVLDIPVTPHEKLRGGLAEQQALNAIPQPRKIGARAHSDAWNNYYFDRNVNTNITLHAAEYVNPLLWRGGLAKGAQSQFQ
jgi:hypothetical protein